MSKYYRDDYSKKYDELREDEDIYYKDSRGRVVSDYYYLSAVGADARRHVLAGGVYYSEFCSNMSFSMAVFGISVGVFLVRNPVVLGKCEPYALYLGIALVIISELLALLCVIVGGALDIQYRKRMIDVIKGALEHRASTEGRNMPKIMLDTMQYDRLLDATETYDRLLKLQSGRKIELLTTHIQRDELAAIGDVRKRTLLEAILAHARLIPTRGVILDKSRVGFARLGNDEDHSLIEHIRGEAWERNSNDALIAATAAKDADLFVTDDKTLTKRLRSYPGIKCDIVDFEEFQRRLANLSSLHHDFSEVALKRRAS